MSRIFISRIFSVPVTQCVWPSGG